MRYEIKKLVFSSPGSIEIDEEQYKRIKMAIVSLFELLFYEEKLDLVIENFQEYESELLLIASRDMVFKDADYFSMSRERNTVSRRIVNLLSTCKMYLDQSIQHVNNMFGKNSEISSFLGREITSQYDNNFSYRVMEALRNYTQHRGFPIQNMTFSGEWLEDENEENHRLLHTVIPIIDVSELAEDGKFKKSVLNELLLISTKGEFDIRPFIRNYIEGIGNIHEKVRDVIRPDVEIWENIISNVIVMYRNEFGSDTSLAGLSILAIDENNHLIEKKAIFNEFIKKRKALESKNRFYVNLHTRYASNEIRKKDSNG